MIKTITFTQAKKSKYAYKKLYRKQVFITIPQLTSTIIHTRIIKIKLRKFIDQHK